MKKIIALSMAAAMAAACTACGGAASSAPASSAPAASSEAASAPAAAEYKVGVCQLVPHVALDAATQGFADVLKAELGIEVEVQNAGGDVATCGTIVNGYVSGEYDLIMGNATPALQAAASATGDIPVLGTSITEYGVALGIENFSGLIGSNVSGTSDLAPLDQQAAMIKEWMPDAKTVGLLYCSAEANSQYQVDVVQAELEAMGYECTPYPFSDTNDMQSVTQKAADNSDVLYVPTDNTIAANAGIVDNICRPAGIPVFAGEEGICGGCGVATLSISYYDLGTATGKMAVKILTGESKVEEMPIEYAPQFTKKYNEAICADLGLTAPEGYVAIEQ